MTGVVLRFMVYLTALFGAVLYSICFQQRAETNVLDSILTPPPGCHAPCWEGIRPGVTSADEAFAILARHPWVDGVAANDKDKLYGIITWRWNGRQPVYINTHAPSVVYIVEGVVDRVQIQTTLEFGDVWLRLGQPERGGFAYGDGPGILRPTEHIADYTNSGVAFFSPLDCQDFWRQRANVVIRSALTFDEGVLSEYDLLDYRLASCHDE